MMVITVIFTDVGTGSIFIRSGTTYITNANGTKTSIATNQVQDNQYTITIMLH